MLIQRILSAKGGEVLTVASSTTIADAVACLAEHRIGALVVSDDDGATVDRHPLRARHRARSRQRRIRRPRPRPSPT